MSWSFFVDYFGEKLLFVKVLIEYSKICHSLIQWFLCQSLPKMCSYPLELEGKKAMRKHQIQHIVVKHLVNIEAFKKTMLETLSETYGPYNIEMKKLQLE